MGYTVNGISLDKTEITSRLNNIHNAQKGTHWIDTNLQVHEFNDFSRMVWKANKIFPFIRTIFFRANAKTVRQNLVQLKLSTSNDQQLFLSCSKSIGQFNKIVRKIYKENTIDAMIKNHMETQISDTLVKKNLLRIHLDVLNQSNTPEKNEQLVPNIFGDQAFDEKVQSPGSEHAIFRYMKDLAAYCEHLQKTGQREEAHKINEIQEEYLRLYISALFRRAIKNSDDNQALKNEGKRLLKEDILAVKNGEKPRGAWLAGSKDHFVPMRYEMDKSTNQLQIGFFDLGGGMHQRQQLLGGKVFNEIRVGEYHRGRVVCTPQFIGNHLDTICQNIIRLAAKGNLQEWKRFYRNQVPTSTENQLDWHHLFQNENPLETRVQQNPQRMGDCTCRGQWALLKKEFARLQLNDHYKQFKAFLEKRNLERLPKPTSISLGAANEASPLSADKIYSLCWAHFHNVSLKNRERGKMISLPMAHPRNDSLCLFIDDLFNGKKKVVIGRNPIACQSPKTALYSIVKNNKDSQKKYAEISGAHLELTKNKQGTISVKVLGRNGVTVKKSTGEVKQHGKDCVFSLHAGDSILLTNTENSYKLSLS